VSDITRQLDDDGDKGWLVRGFVCNLRWVHRRT